MKFSFGSRLNHWQIEIFLLLGKLCLSVASAVAINMSLCLSSPRTHVSNTVCPNLSVHVACGHASVLVCRQCNTPMCFWFCGLRYFVHNGWACTIPIEHTHKVWAAQSKSGARFTKYLMTILWLSSIVSELRFTYDGRLIYYEECKAFLNYDSLVKS